MKYYNSNILPKLVAVAGALAAALGWFIKKVIKKGRVNEFIASTFVLFGAYYLTFNCATRVSIWGVLTPFLCYVGYWFWLFSNEKVTSIYSKSEWAHKNWWWQLDGWEFEEEVAKVFRLNGYAAEVTKRTGDGGADIVLYKNDEKYVVQCKHWRQEVPVSCMRELKGIQEDLNADKLIMIASSGITRDAKDFISNKPYYTMLTLDDIIRMALRPEG